MVSGFAVAGRRIGPGASCLVIAEAGVNHNGDLALAHRLVDIAAEAGADAVKFQTFRTDRLVTADAPKAAYQEVATGGDESQRDMLRRLELSAEAHGELAAHCARRDLLFLSTPFEEESADFLERLGVPAFKVPSGELTNLPFLRHLATKGRPLIVSTGMATLEEVGAAVDAVRNAGAPPLALLHCVSAYPAVAADSNLRAMDTLARTFGVPVGWSDHTLGIEVALAAVALGAAILEKHFTLDRTLPGPDHRASLEPGELAALVTQVRRVESALGDGRKVPTAAETDTARVARKSLVAARDLAPGTRLGPDDVAVRRPGTGISPAHLDQVLGRRLVRAVPVGGLLAIDMFEAF
jgi:N-acetylneuraminate synthase/N,N'-diacetyllegionaminate synthase